METGTVAENQTDPEPEAKQGYLIINPLLKKTFIMTKI